MRMSPFQLNGNVPIGTGWREPFCASRGDIDEESEGTESDHYHGGRESQSAEPSAGGRDAWVELSAGQACLAAISGPRRRGLGASAPWQAGITAQAPAVAGASAGALRRGTLRGFRSDTDGRGVGEGRLGGGSRHAAAVAVGGGEPDGAAATPAASTMAGAQAVLWGDGATGRLAS
jgi:hypothetical protein